MRELDSWEASSPVSSAWTDPQLPGGLCAGSTEEEKHRRGRRITLFCFSAAERRVCEGAPAERHNTHITRQANSLRYFQQLPVVEVRFMGRFRWSVESR